MLLKSRFVEMFGDINLPNTKWEMSPLGKNAALINGRAYKQEELLDSGKYKLLRVGNFFSTKDWYYSDLELEEDKYCDTGDLLFAWSASFGAKIWDQGKVIYHYHIWKIIPNKNYNKEFLCFLLNEKTESLKKQTHGSTMMHLTKIGMEETLFMVPPISLQKQFVEFIHQIDKLKVILKQIDEKFELLKKSRFVEMFGAEKNKVTLKECCEIHARIGWQALTKDEHMKSGDYMLVTGTDFDNNSVNYDSCVYVSKDRYEMDPHIILKNDDILVTKDGTIGKVAIVKGLPKPATLNSGIFVIRPDERFDKDYIANVFKGPIFSQFVDEVKTGATIKHLNQGKLQHFEIPVPSLSKQIQFSKFCNQLDKLKVETIKKLQELIE